MLIVAGHIDLDPARRDDFLSDRRDSIQTARAEVGCLTYALSPDPLEPGRVLLFERWENMDALAAHLQGAQSAPRPASDIEILGVEILQYEVGKVGPLGS